MTSQGDVTLKYTLRSESKVTGNDYSVIVPTAHNKTKGILVLVKPDFCVVGLFSVNIPGHNLGKTDITIIDSQWSS